MTTLLQLPDYNIQILAQVLVHFIWQGTAVVLLLAAVVSSARMRRPTVRYQCSLLALASMAAAPLVTYCWIAASHEVMPLMQATMPHQESDSEVLPDLAASGPPATVPGDIRGALEEPNAGNSGDETAINAASERVESDRTTPRHVAALEPTGIRHMRLWDRATPWIVFGWFIGVAALSLRLLLGWIGVTRLRRGAVTPPDWVTDTIARLGSSLHVAAPLIRLSHQVGEAIALGFVKPMILLPVAWVTELPTDMLEAVIAHELAHIRRRDLWVNLMQRVVETLLFYHPAVWWLSRRIRIERELCCDEMVVSVTQNRLRYAETLEHIGRLCLTPARSVLMVSITGNRTVLLDRIRHILNLQPRDRSLNVWLAGALPLLIAGLIWGGSVTLQEATVVADDKTVTVDKKPVDRPPEAPAAPKDGGSTDSDVGVGESLPDLIAAVRKQEALFRNYSATIKSVREYAPLSKEEEKERARQNTFDFGPMVLRSVTEIKQQSVRDQQYKFEGEEIFLLTSGEKLTDSRQSVSDGSKTIDIEVGKSATVHAGRAETPRLLPPHTWGMYLLHVNFRLSVYMSGTEAVKLEPKAGRHPVERGSIHEFYKVEAERVGDEMIEGLACIKVRVNRWNYSKSDPFLQYLWLAKDRNLHVARATSGFMKKGQETISQALHVTKWQEVGPGVWLPVAVEVEPLPKEERPGRINITYQFVVEKATLNPEITPGFFELPSIPKSVPTLYLDLNAQLTDSPDHPVAAKAASDTTLESILDRLASEEQKYQQYEVLTHEINSHLNLDGGLSGGSQLSLDAHQRTVVSGQREYYEEKSTRKGADGSTTTSTDLQADDGTFVRTVSEYSAAPKPSVWGSLHLGANNKRSAVRPHTLVLGHDRKLQSLAAHLRSGWSDVINKYPLTVEYVGDELVGGLHCHKLKCTTINNLYYMLWLARDRNLLVIRRMWYEPSRHKSLPTSLGHVDDLRELRPGVWFPYHATYYAFRKFGQEGLEQNRLTLQWRNEITVDQLISEPAIDETLFQGADLPAGSNVVVVDGPQRPLGQFKQPQSGKISISPEALLEMRQKARVDKEEADRRQQALDALVGKPAPELPRGTWLNSEPLTWKALAGKVVIVDFWATWCGPCEADLQRLAGIQKAYQDNDIKDRVILGIHTAGTERDTIAKIANEKKLTYPIIIDSIANSGERSWGDLFGKFAVKQLPLTMVVDRDGKIVAHGPLEKMLNEAAKLTEKKE